MLKLFDHQERSVQKHLAALKAHGGALDSSDTGCHAPGTPILMYDGSTKPVESINCGDLVMGWDSTPQRVLRTVQGREEMFRIVPVKGSPFIVNGKHILTLVTTGKSGKVKGRGGLVEDIPLDEWAKLCTARKHELKLFRAAVTCWRRKSQRIDPYFMGVLLGDGGLTHGVSVSKPNSEIEELCNEQARAWGGRIRKAGVAGNPTFYFVGIPELTSALEYYGLAGKDSGSKSIPEEYKTGDWGQRSELLAGLLDTDGHLDNRGFDYISKSQPLSEGVAYVARSLGLAAYIKPCTKQCQNNFSGEYWRVSISGDCSFLPTRLPNRRAPARTQIKSVLRTGFKVESVGEGEFFGFALDGDGRFLMGDFTVTHNTGKTLVACTVAKLLNVPTLVVAPKTVIHNWHEAAESVGTELSVMNYEKVRTGNTPYGEWRVPEGKIKKRFFWHQNIGLLIFDEGHRMAGLKSQNSELGMGARRQRIPALVLTATPADNPMQMRALGYILGLHDGDETNSEGRNLFRNVLPFGRWARRHGCGPTTFSQFDFRGGEDDRKKSMEKIHGQIFGTIPPRGVRVRHADIPDFPETQITAELIDLGDSKRMGKLYAEMQAAVEALHRRDAESKQALREKLEKRGVEVNPEDLEHPITLILRARQEIELLKVPGTVEMVNDAIAEGHSVVLFVNFTQTRKELCARLQTGCFVDGSQTGARGERERRENIRRFMADEERVIICTDDAGKEAISLHDTHGNHPRLTLIFPGFSAAGFRQKAGRVHRAGGKTRSLQRALFALGTVEEKPYKALRSKLGCMGALLDGLTDSDFNPFEAPIPEAPPLDIEPSAEQDTHDERDEDDGIPF